MPVVHVPIVGNVPKPALVMGAIAAVGITGYVIYRHNKESKQAAAGMTAYGYGSYAYGYYNPYTGQWLGPGGQQPPITGGSGSGSGGSGGGTGGGGTGAGGGTHTVTSNGKLDLYYFAKVHGITEGKLIRLNPQLSHLVGSKKPIPRGTRVKV